MKFQLFTLSLILCLSVNFAAGQNRVYTVQQVSVTDGDTLRLRFDNGFEFDARLHGIDAPELSQTFGAECKTVLENLTDGKVFRIWILAEDKYNRKIVKLFRDDYTEINLDIVSAGCAWLASPRRSERAKYTAAYKQARLAKLGLWSIGEPCNPRRFRKRGDC